MRRRAPSTTPKYNPVTDFHIMRHTVGKKLAGKPDKTAEEQDMLDLLQNGGSRVSEENLRPVLEWCKNAGAQTQD